MHNREKRTAWLDHTAGRSDTKADEKEWTDLWKVKVHSKVRVFLWRLARQTIPAKDLRFRRNMADDFRCSLCGEPDSWKHALLECHMASGVSFGEGGYY